MTSVALLAVVTSLVATAPRARSHLVAGELVRIDLGRRVLTLKTAEAPPREIEVAVEGTTRIRAGGRAVRLEDLRTGERALVSCTDGEPGRHAARWIKIGPSRYAAPSPPGTSPRP